MRQDYQFSALVLIGWLAWRGWRSGGPQAWLSLVTGAGGRRSRVVVGLLVVALAVALAGLARQVNFGGAGQRGWFAFEQHYAVRLVQIGEAPGLNPFADYPKLIARDFPGARSLGDAWRVNRAAMVRHVRWNVGNAVGVLAMMWRTEATRRAAAILLGLATGWILLTRSGRGADPAMGGSGIERRSWGSGWLALSAVGVAGPGLIVLAKDAYLLPALPLVAGLLGGGLWWLGRWLGGRSRAPGLAFRQSRGATLAVGLVIAGVAAVVAAAAIFVPGSRPRPVAETVVALRAIWPANGSACLGRLRRIELFQLPRP